MLVGSCMKIGVVGDVHWCSYSSIVRSNGEKYSRRLENLIQSVNWAEEKLSDCDLIVYLGDFFDRSDLNSQEITALKEIHWNSKHHCFLLGNHEKYTDEQFNSLYFFNLNFEIITKPTRRAGQYLYFLPYGNYDKPLREIFDEDAFPDRLHIVFSHNDIKGLQYGEYVSTVGVDIQDIREFSNVYINGHLHNHQEIGDKIINLGNLTGQNFSEDASKYKHYVMTIDSQTLEINYYQNPYSLNFYRLDLTESLSPLDSINGQSVLSIVTNDTMLESVKQCISELPGIVEYRIVTFASANPKVKNKIENKEIGSPEHFYSFLADKGITIPKEFIFEVLK